MFAIFLVHFWSSLVWSGTGYARGSASAERVGQGEVGGVTRRVTCTWWLLGLAVKVPWLEPCGPILALAAWTGFENATLTL